MFITKIAGRAVFFSLAASFLFLALPMMGVFSMGCGGGAIETIEIEDLGGTEGGGDILVSIENGATGVNPRNGIVFNFGREMNTASVESNFSISIKALNASTSTSLGEECRWRWSAGKDSATVNCPVPYCVACPDESAADCRGVNVKISGEALDAAGNKLSDFADGDIDVSYETGANPGDIDGQDECMADIVVGFEQWINKTSGFYNGQPQDYYKGHKNMLVTFLGPSGYLDMIKHYGDYFENKDGSNISVNWYYGSHRERRAASGGTVATAGDMNGDDFPDILMSAPLADSSGSVLLVALDMDIEKEFLPGVSTVDYRNFGLQLKPAGDVNKDGFNDFIAAADSYKGSSPWVMLNYEGMSPWAMLYLGASSSSGVGASPIELSTDGDVVAIAGDGDIDGDGFNDVILTTLRTDGEDGTQLNVFMGGAGFPTSTTKIITSSSADYWFGISVALGDDNGDSYDDVLVGAPTDGSVGKAYIFKGEASFSPTGDTDATTVITGSVGSFGYDGVAAGDVNGDGYEDVLISAPKAYSSRGEVYLFLGRSADDWSSGMTYEDADLTIYGTKALNLLHVSYENRWQHLDDWEATPEIVHAAGVGDVNNDGYDDFAVWGQKGIYIFYGEDSMPSGRMSAHQADAVISFSGDPIVFAPGDGTSSALYIRSVVGRFRE